MKVGVPKEVKNHEYRVAITPAGVHELVRNGHEVFIEQGAGVGSSIPDEDFVAAGARMLPTADDVWQTGDLVLKVKEPVAEEYHRMRKDQVLFTYLHLAASRACTDALLGSGITAIAYETVQLPDGSLPLLAPMSEVAGRMAPQVGAHHLQRDGGGRGVLMGGVSGVYAAKVVVLGAGVSGMNAAAIALGMQAEVLLVDKNVGRLRSADAIYQGHLQTVASNAYEIERAVIDADLVIGAVLVPGAKAPMLVSNELVSRMKSGVGARRHLDRPGRMLRGLQADHARRADLPGAQLGVLLRGQHAGRGAAHLDVRADQRDAAVHDRDREPRLARGAAGRPVVRARAEHPRRRGDLRAGRRGARTGLDARWPRSWPDGGPALTTVAAAVRRYLDHLTVERGLAAHTIEAYRRDLQRYASTLAASGTTRIGEVTTADVAEYLAVLREGDEHHPPLAASSAGRAVVAVRGLHAFALAEGLAEADPARAVRPPAPPRRLPRAIPMPDVERLLQIAGDSPAQRRDRALLELLYGTGARISEAVGLDVDDLDLAGQRGTDGALATVRLAGKGGRQRIVPVGSYALARWRPTWCRPGRRWPPAPGRAAARPSSSTPAAAGSPGRVPGARCGRGRQGRPGRDLAAHAAAFVRHPPARRRRRRPGGAGTARPCLGQHDAGLHAGDGGQAARGVRGVPSARAP